MIMDNETIENAGKGLIRFYKTFLIILLIVIIFYACYDFIGRFTNHLSGRFIPSGLITFVLMYVYGDAVIERYRITPKEEK